MKKLIVSLFYVFLAVAAQAQQYAVYATPSGVVKPLPNGQTVHVTAGGGGAVGQIQWNNAGLLDGFTMSGDVTVVPSTGIATIGTGVVSNSKLATMAASTFKGNNSGGTGVPSDLSVSQAKTLLAISTSDVSGLGSMALQSSGSISVTGGTESGVDISGGTISGTAISGGTITGLPSPSASSDAATKAYVDGVASGIVQRTGVTVATTANITLSGEQTIDGVLTSSTRIMVKNQSAPAQNGIYVTASGAWSRATDSNTAGQLLVGYYYFVASGSTQGSTGWTIQTAPTTLGTDPVVFSQFSASASYSAGSGLNLVGNVFSNIGVRTLTGTANEITSSASTGTPVLSLPASLTFTGKTVTGGIFNATAFNGPLGGTTPSTVAGTSGNFSGQITSTLPTGTAPFVVSSTTQVANLNAATAGSATSATNSTNATNTAITDDTTTNATMYPTWVTSTSGNLPQKTSSSKLTFNPSTGIVSSTGFTGAHNGTLGAITPNTVVGTTFASTSNANIRTSKANFNLTVVNVKDYGAVGNGSTADEGAINSAIAALTSNSTLYFPPGIYRITSGLTTLTGISNVTITGDSAEIYNDSGSAGGNVWVFDPSCSYINCYGMVYSGTSTVRGSGIVFRCGASYSQIHDNIFLAGCASDFAIHVTGASGSWSSGNSVYNNSITGPLGDGIHFGNTTDGLIANNNISGTGDDSIAVVADDPSHPPNRISVVGNIIYNSGGAATSVSGSGIRVAEGIDVQVSDNQINTTWESAIHVTRYLSTTSYNTRVTVSGNKIYNSTTHSGPRAAIWLEWCDQSNVINNQIIDPANGAAVAILDCSDLTVKDNFMRGIPFRGIVFDDSTTSHVATSWTQIMITGNDFDWVKSNEAIYAVPASGITVTNLVITGNNAVIVGGNWIYYDRANTGRVFNNTNASGATVAAGGSVTGVTFGNNN